MKKTYGLLVLLSLLFVAGKGFSQEPEAKDVLAAASKKIHDFKSVEISFEYGIHTVENTNDDVFKGEFIVKDEKYRMTIDETVTYCNGKTRWVYLVESNEVNVSDVEKGDDLELEEQFLNDPLSIYDLFNNDFKIRLNGTGEMDGLKVYEIDLTPNDLDKPYFKIRFLITEKNDLYSVKYFQKDGTKVLLTVTSVKGDQKFKENDFNFNAANHPDVEVIDLR